MATVAGPDAVTHPDGAPLLREGATALNVPLQPGGRASATRGPGTKGDEPFFNPAMRFARDLTVVAIEERLQHARPDRPFLVYDGLAATGARGLRIAKECRAPEGVHLEVVLNDRSREACALILDNARANELTDRVTVSCDDFAEGLAGRRFDHIDVDPFGSPAPFLDAATRHLRHDGTLALTATDTRALCGVFPAVCRRRYDALPWRGPGMHEVALRILIGSVVRHAARYDLALMPLVSHATDHYVRTWLHAERGAQKADAALDQIGFAVELADGTRRLVARKFARPADANRWAGPLWTGPLHDGPFVHALAARAGSHPQLDARPLARFLEIAAGEADAPPLHYEVGEVASRLQMSPPRFDAILERLRAAGFRAARTHTRDAAFRTDATMDQLAAVFAGPA